MALAPTLVLKMGRIIRARAGGRAITKITSPDGKMLLLRGLWSAALKWIL
jgi:hypothetical protein